MIILSSSASMKGLWGIKYVWLLLLSFRPEWLGLNVHET